jgi:general secretion pathway protein M
MAWQHTLKARWLALAPREQRGLTLAASALLVALAWTVLLAPALRTLRGAAAQHAKLDMEMERMQAMQTRAKLLQSKPVVSTQDGLGALQNATTQLGKGAALQVSGDLATVTLKQVSAQTLAPWFAPVSAAGLSPADVHLQRNPGPGEALWSGVLVFRLPASAGAPR